jgi:hypothetical protein
MKAFIGLVLVLVGAFLLVSAAYILSQNQGVIIRGHVAVPSIGEDAIDGTDTETAHTGRTSRCDPYQCKPVPNAPVRIVRAGPTGWYVVPGVSAATDESGDFEIVAVGRVFSSGGPAYVAAVADDGEFPLMAAVPSKIADEINISIDRTTTAAAVLHCPSGLYPPPTGSYCFSDSQEGEGLESIIDGYFSDHPSASLDPAEYLPVVSTNSKVQDEMDRILSENGLSWGISPITDDNANSLVNVVPSLATPDGSASDILNVKNAELPRWKSGAYGSYELAPGGGTPPYHCRLKDGSHMPEGFTLSDGCTISGRAPPLPSGTTKTVSPPFTVAVTDSGNPPSSLRLQFSVVTVTNLPELVSLSPARCRVDRECIVRVADAVGGAPPYTFQSDTFANGAPPMGLIVDLSGFLRGNARTEGEYDFGICVKDSVGSSSCGMASVIVEEASTTAPRRTPQTVPRITGGCEPGHIPSRCPNGDIRCCLNGQACCGGNRCTPKAWC